MRDGDGNVFGIRRNPQLAICPIKWIEQYMVVARDLKIDLTTSYLFRPTNPQGGIVDSPFSSATAEARLKSYLKEMRADDGDMLHGFRFTLSSPYCPRWGMGHGFCLGCPITLALTGADLSEIMHHVGWTRRHTALYYLQLAKVLKPSVPQEGWRQLI